MRINVEQEYLQLNTSSTYRDGSSDWPLPSCIKASPGAEKRAPWINTLSAPTISVVIPSSNLVLSHAPLAMTSRRQ